MMFLTFAGRDGHRLGLVLADKVLDLTASWPANSKIAAPRDVAELTDAGEPGLSIVRDLALAPVAANLLERASLRLMAPIPRPRRNVFCVGRNYKEHIDEGLRAQGKVPAPLPSVPEFFSKPPTTVIASGATIPLHVNTTEELDYEAELAVIIGQGGMDITAERAFDHIFGYSIINDITGRDLQRRYGQWFKGKGLNGSCPFGPVVVHASVLATVGDLRIRSTVNGEVRQDSRTSQMIFSVPQIVEHLSRGLTLEPGDIIATGTPSGVGYAMTPPSFLASGDRISIEVEGIGILENAVGD